MEQYNFGNRTNWKTVTIDGKTWRKSDASEPTNKLRERGRVFLTDGGAEPRLLEAHEVPHNATSVQESDFMFYNLNIPQKLFADCFDKRGMYFPPYKPDGPLNLHEEFMQWFEAEPVIRFVWWKKFINFWKKLFNIKNKFSDNYHMKFHGPR